jgi:signal transduction histidine kinase
MSLYILSWIFAAAINLGLGLFVYARNPRSEVNRTFMFAVLCIAFWAVDLFGLAVAGDGTFARRWSLVFINSIVFVSSCGFHFLCAYSGSITPRIRRYIRAAYIISTGFALANLLGFFPRDYVRVGLSYTPRVTALYLVFLANTAFWLLFGMLRVFRAYRTTSSPRLRRQIELFLVGIGLVLLFGMSNLLLSFGVPIYPLGGFVTIGWTGLVAYAILRYQAMDIRIIVRTGIMYAFTTGMILALYSGLVGVAYILLGARFVQQRSVFINAVAAMIIAGGFLPVRNLLQRWVDRLFFRERQDYQRVMHDFSMAMAMVGGMGNIAALVVHTISAVFKARGVCFIIREEGSVRFKVYSSDPPDTAVPAAFLEGAHPVIARLHTSCDAVFLNEYAPAHRELLAAGFRVAVPVHIRGALQAAVLLQEKRSEEIYTREDVEFLRLIAGQTGLVMENLHLNERARILERQLFQADKLVTIGTFAATVAHEMKNPLVSIKTFMQLLPRKRGDEAFMDRFINTVPGEVDRMERRLGELLSFSRAGRHAPRQVDPAEVMDSLLTLLRYELSQARIHVTRRYDPSRPSITADDEQLRQLFMNLVLNAIQAMPDGGTLSVVTSCTEGVLCISVSDTGIGIPKEKLDLIFQPFYSTKPNGTGLGLAVVQRVVRDCGGTIAVSSTEGRGTSFDIRIPLS